jgi:hypothetical protein
MCGGISHECAISASAIVQTKEWRSASATIFALGSGNITVQHGCAAKCL